MDGKDDANFQAEVRPVMPEDVTPPPSYEEVMGLYMTSVQESKSDLPILAYIDIMPRLLHQGNMANKIAPWFQSFEEIVDGANTWLRDHPGMCVWKCETVERKVNSVSASGTVSVDLECMSHTESVYGFNCFVFGLRLWLTRNQGTQVQELGLINVTPQKLKVDLTVYHRTRVFGVGRRCLVASNLMLEPYEGLKKTLERFNSKVKDNPIPGSILNVESTNLKFADSSDNISIEAAASASSWHEDNGMSSKRFTQILRLFYIKGSPTSPTIRMQDFIPQQENGREVYSVLKFARFNSVQEEAATWIQHQKGIQIVNVETRDARVNRTFGHGKAEVESDSADYFQFTRMNESRLRFLRVFYIDNPAIGSFQDTVMTSRIFVPAPLGPGKFESMVQTMDRIDAWLKLTGLPLFGVETVVYPKENIAGSTINSSLFTVKLFTAKHWVTAIRVYFSAAFEEPDPCLLPPLPKMKSSACTVL